MGVRAHVSSLLSMLITDKNMFINRTMAKFQCTSRCGCNKKNLKVNAKQREPESHR